MLSAGRFYNLLVVTLFTTDRTEGSVYDVMRLIRINNPKNDILGHLKINSLRSKFDGIMDIAATNLIFFLVSESKIDDCFAQFSHEGYCKPYRKDMTIWGGGLLRLVNENIP